MLTQTVGGRTLVSLALLALFAACNSGGLALQSSQFGCVTSAECLPTHACVQGRCSLEADGNAPDASFDSGQTMDAGADAGADSGTDAGPETKSDSGVDGGPFDGGPFDGGLSNYCESGWCWRFPQPHGNTINAVAATSQQDIWLGADFGIMTHWNGSRFDVVEKVPVGDVTGLWLSPTRTLFAVGYDGVLARRSGSGQWTPLGNLPPSSPLNGLWGTADDNLWVVGRDGFIARWDGTTLTKQISLTNNSLNAIQGVSATDIWVVGDGGLLLHFDGMNWSFATSNTTANLYSLVMIAADNVWAGGDGKVSHFNGSTWTASDTPAGSIFYAMQFDGNTIVAAIGDVGPYLYGRSVDGGWAGETTDQEATFALAKCGSNCIAGGGFSGRLLIRPGIPNWISMNGPHEWVFHDIHGTGPNDVWVVGFTIRHWDGTQFTKFELPLPDPGTVRGVYAVSETSAWAATDQGKILRWQDAGWELQPQSALLPINAMHGSGADNVWLVGNMGLAMRFNGTQWLTVPTTTMTDFRGVFAASPTNVWVVGEGGYVAKWDGIGWNVMGGVPSDVRVQEVEVEPNRITIVGNRPGRFDCILADTTADAGGFSVRLDSTAEWCGSITSFGGRRFIGVSGGLAEWDGGLVTTHFSYVESLTVWAAGAEDLWWGGYLGNALHHAP